MQLTVSLRVAVSYDAENHPESIALSRITSIGQFLPELWQTTAAIPDLPQAIRARMHSDIGDVSATLWMTKSFWWHAMLLASFQCMKRCGMVWSM
jgi:hypothetical protein